MKIIIKETGLEDCLIIVDKNTGCEWTADLIEAGGMESDEDGNTIMSQDDFDWWKNYISDHEKTEEEAEELAEKLEAAGFDESQYSCSALTFVLARLADNAGNDYDDHRSSSIAAMQEIKETFGIKE